MSYISKEEDSHPRHKESRNIENVLVLQGGGSLGAFACGVFKALVKKNIRIDIVAGTSIGAANAAMFGVPKMFTPVWSRWLPWSHDEDDNNKIYDRNKRDRREHYYDFLNPRNWTYFYDHSPLAKTLDRYIDYKRLNLAATKEELPEVLRLIITAVDVMTARPLVFDNAKMEIKAKHILASSGYPVYGFPWIEVEDNVYAWDGSLLSNTPVREVIEVSPRNDKNIFIVENYPRKIYRLPSNMAEVESRAKHIIFNDKNMDNIKMSRLITRHIQLIESLYDIVQNKVDPAEIDRHQLEKIKSEYNTLINNYGAQIKSVTRIVRSELESPSMLQNADFYPKTIKELIAQGETKTMEKLSYCQSVNYDFNIK